MLMLTKSFTNMVVVAKEPDSSTNGDTGKKLALICTGIC